MHIIISILKRETIAVIEPFFLFLSQFYQEIMTATRIKPFWLWVAELSLRLVLDGSRCFWQQRHYMWYSEGWKLIVRVHNDLVVVHNVWINWKHDTKKYECCKPQTNFIWTSVSYFHLHAYAYCCYN